MSRNEKNPYKTTVAAYNVPIKRENSLLEVYKCKFLMGKRNFCSNANGVSSQEWFNLTTMYYKKGQSKVQRTNG